MAFWTRGGQKTKPWVCTSGESERRPSPLTGWAPGSQSERGKELKQSEENLKIARIPWVVQEISNVEQVVQTGSPPGAWQKQMQILFGAKYFHYRPHKCSYTITFQMQ